MKKIRNLIIIMMACLMFFGGCGTKVIVGNDSPDSDNDNGIITNDETDDITSDVIFTAEVLEVNNSLLVAPDKDSNEYKSSDKISVGLKDAEITGIEGEAITMQELKVGDLLQITYNGMIAESYPAQIGASKIKVIGHNILIDGYLALIDDIYREDSGLNGEIEIIALDTTGWIEITDYEKEMILQEMEDIYSLEIMEGTYEELRDQGLINEEDLYFPNGILITITEMNYNERKEKINYSIKKWRGGLGAIGSDDAKAEYKDGQWVITKENMWIS